MTDIFQRVLINVHTTNVEAQSRKERSICGDDEFFDNVVKKCSLCKDVCEAKARSGLNCPECKNYISQQLDIMESKAVGDDNTIILVSLIILLAVTLLVIGAIIFMAIKLYKQKHKIDNISRRKLLEIGVACEISDSGSKSHLNNLIIPKENSYTDTHWHSLHPQTERHIT